MIPWIEVSTFIACTGTLVLISEIIFFDENWVFILSIVFVVRYEMGGPYCNIAREIIKLSTIDFILSWDSVYPCKIFSDQFFCLDFYLLCCRLYEGAYCFIVVQKYLQCFTLVLDSRAGTLVHIVTLYTKVLYYYLWMKSEHFNRTWLKVPITLMNKNIPVPTYRMRDYWSGVICYWSENSVAFKSHQTF